MVQEFDQHHNPADPFVDFSEWYKSRFGYEPDPLEVKIWQENLSRSPALRAQLSEQKAPLGHERLEQPQNPPRRVNPDFFEPPY